MMILMNGWNSEYCTHILQSFIDLKSMMELGLKGWPLSYNFDNPTIQGAYGTFITIIQAYAKFCEYIQLSSKAAPAWCAGAQGQHDCHAPLSARQSLINQIGHKYTYNLSILGYVIQINYQKRQMERKQEQDSPLSYYFWRKWMKEVLGQTLCVVGAIIVKYRLFLKPLWDRKFPRV